jgi:two-component system, NarL family, sensor histidine kinase UhpB
MSLRYQINIRIFFLSLSVLLLGGTIVVWQARSAVNQEVNSSIQLAVKLIQFGFTHTSVNQQNAGDWLPQLNALKEIRHLSVQLSVPSGQTLSFSQPTSHFDHTKPPHWFIRLVQGEPIKTQQPIMLTDGKQLLLNIEADPLDEISEVWQENIAFFSSFALLMVLSFFAVNLVFNKTLNSISTIVDTLNVIATGQYQQKLPNFAIAEYDSIAKAINQLADKLNTVQQENRTLTQHSLEIQEDERRRLAQELHDELGQSLTAIKVMAGTAARPNANLQQSTDAIMHTCDHLISVVRSMMHQLHPLVLTELGLKASLEDLVQHWTLRHPELSINLQCADEVDSLAANSAIQLFRVIQECLTNMVRHANASRAEIRLAISADSLQLTVSDNGQGCSNDEKTGFGLRGMKERINSLSGELSLHSQAGQGMTILARIPL